MTYQISLIFLNLNTTHYNNKVFRVDFNISPVHGRGIFKFYQTSKTELFARKIYLNCLVDF